MSLKTFDQELDELDETNLSYIPSSSEPFGVNLTSNRSPLNISFENPTTFNFTDAMQNETMNLENSDICLDNYVEISQSKKDKLIEDSDLFEEDCNSEENDSCARSHSSDDTTSDDDMFMENPFIDDHSDDEVTFQCEESSEEVC